MRRKATHPLSVGIDSGELAVAYESHSNDPFPHRPREIVCELMHCDPNIPPDAHIRLNKYDMLSKIFVNACRSLVAAARQGRYEWHLAEARHRKVVPQAGALLSGKDLYNFGQLFKDTAYIEAVNARAREAKVAARAAASDVHQANADVDEIQAGYAKRQRL